MSILMELSVLSCTPGPRSRLLHILCSSGRPTIGGEGRKYQRRAAGSTGPKSVGPPKVQDAMKKGTKEGVEQGNSVAIPNMEPPWTLKWARRKGVIQGACRPMPAIVDLIRRPTCVLEYTASEQEVQSAHFTQLSTMTGTTGDTLPEEKRAVPRREDPLAGAATIFSQGSP
ncbi:hypothetical protein NDU88_002858 [Pleurodeles waltl]|uniref:Uncharacterized protein n=1 Tax=Pleurodeles waltl TaxID=8319 RepID=A0AAV7PAX7_PLEWA|nr:hypothetical protein NDU88_002858 [Pleurodeles waltl]